MRLHFALIVTALLLCSCGKILVIVSDPYVSRNEGGVWGPAGLGFNLRSRLAGYRPQRLFLDEEMLFSEILEDYGEPDLFILSPLASLELAPSLSEHSAIVVGGNPESPLFGNMSVLSPDRTEAFAKAGRLAALMAEEIDGFPLALFSVGTSRRDVEREALLDAYSEAAPSQITVKVTILPKSGLLPNDFEEALSSAGLLLLFAGPANQEAMLLSSEFSPPVITEDAARSGAWAGRVVASVEDDLKARDRIVITEIKNFEKGKRLSYPSVLIRGDHPEARGFFDKTP